MKATRSRTCVGNIRIDISFRLRNIYAVTLVRCCIYQISEQLSSSNTKAGNESTLRRNREVANRVNCTPVLPSRSSYQNFEPDLSKELFLCSLFFEPAHAPLLLKRMHIPSSNLEPAPPPAAFGSEKLCEIKAWTSSYLMLTPPIRARQRLSPSIAAFPGAGGRHSGHHDSVPVLPS